MERAASALACFDGANESRGASAEDYGVEVVGNWVQYEALKIGRVRFPTFGFAKNGAPTVSSASGSQR